MKRTIYDVYAREGDMTFIMEDTCDADGEPISTECVGWYHGEPDDESTATFIGKLKAEYLMGKEKDEPRVPSETTKNKDSFVVVYVYSDGRKGVVRDPSRHPANYPLEFSTEKEAADWAAELNHRIDDSVKQFFPVYRAEKA